MECPDCKGRGWAAHGVLGTGDCGRCGGSGELTSVTASDDEVRCDQCGDPMNPAARMLGPVCGRCCRRNQRAATG